MKKYKIKTNYYHYHYRLNSPVGFPNNYPLDKDLSSE